MKGSTFNGNISPTIRLCVSKFHCNDSRNYLKAEEENWQYQSLGYTPFLKRYNFFVRPVPMVKPKLHLRVCWPCANSLAGEVAVLKVSFATVKSTNPDPSVFFIYFFIDDFMDIW